MKEFNKEGKRSCEYKSGSIILHGDVVLYCNKAVNNFESLPKLTNGIVALGEITGHSHALIGDYDLREDEKKVKHLRIVGSCTLNHQEHAPIELPLGDYHIGIQKEYDHFEQITREVAD